MMANSVTEKQHEILQLKQKAELVRAEREKARRHLYDYHHYMHPEFIRAIHQELIATELEKVYRYVETGGDEGTSKLMIFAPPQTGKSTMTSMDFPAWVLGKRPDTKIALTSYVSTLAERNSRKVRDQVEDLKFNLLFGDQSVVDVPVELSQDSRSVGDWLIAKPHEGGVLARGVGGGLTGFTQDIIVIDDPFKDRKDAESEGRREDVWDWYASQIVTRIRRGVAQILMHTRWNNDDLAGKLLKQMAKQSERKHWKVLFIPALALNRPDALPTAGGNEVLPTTAESPEEALDLLDSLDRYAKDSDETRRFMERGVYLPTEDPLGREPGESVNEEMYPVEQLTDKRETIGEPEFASVYQQMPKTKSGQMFPREKIKILPTLPAGCVFMRYWDKAGTAGGGGAKSSGVLMAKTPEKRYVVVDAIAGRWSISDRNSQIVNTAVSDKAKYGIIPTWLEQEPGSGGKESAEISVIELAGYDVHTETMSGQGDKTLRAEPFAAQWQVGNVDLLVGDWNELYLKELEAFPFGTIKDLVDASSGVFNKLALMKPKRESRIY
jgi:predicted phage terminase large subunit-like protein